MGRRNRNQLLVRGARAGMNALKADVMRQEGYKVDPARPDDVKYEVAQSLGVPLQQGDNGNLTTEEAGHVGGRIGGPMVRELIRRAQEHISKQP